ncbi:hypothetical protein GCM10027036_37660 [Flavihumibacter cheonanensis]|uniref:DUF4783 domain-containing protein n=1 Tax=Flavihumibacter cheonanensis TaxID=1442385 RepID=UPI001EF8C20C|nr:DUF4783 domain-containing protein [Flavihumibacter cheonanensis]MCG7753770.1 DUF4783 domain-containing protein [Flavihumibacter cheonanensis]
MKAFYTIILLSTMILVSAFKTGAELDSVLGALKTGDATQLSRYFDSRVDITLPEKSDNYSRSQAVMVIKDFFISTGGVKTFELKHHGENNGSNFLIGVLQTNNGSYRTTLFLKQKGEKAYLQEMRFMEE